VSVDSAGAEDSAVRIVDNNAQSDLSSGSKKSRKTSLPKPKAGSQAASIKTTNDQKAAAATKSKGVTTASKKKNDRAAKK